MKKALLIFTGLIVLTGTIFYGLNKKSIDKQASEFFETPSFTIMLLGTDSLFPGKLNGWRGRSDVIILFHYNAESKRLHLLSVPRDTYITLKDHEFHKINSANQAGGYRLAKFAVEKLTKMTIDHMVIINIRGFIKLFNDMGPFKIFVPNKMSYHDNSANLHIEIQPGLQEMNGSELVKYLRFRDSLDGDIGRITRQQIFFRSAMKKFFEPDFVYKIPQILINVDGLFKTDMNFRELVELGLFFRDADFDSIKTHILPGNFGEDGYWIVNQVKLRSLISDITGNEIEIKNSAKSSQ